MGDVLAHTRPLFGKDRVIAGPTQFFAMSRHNLCCGPVRDSIEESEVDADRIYATAERVSLSHLGWGVCP